MWFRAFRDFEQTATEIMAVQCEIVPGILQTEAYTRAVFAGAGDDPHGEIADRNLRIRQERKAILTRENPPQYSFVLSESCLRRQYGGPKVMAEQLDHLAELALLPNVTIQVIPFNALSPAGVGQGFVIFRFDEDTSTDIVYIEIWGDSLYLDKPPEVVNRYERQLARLYGGALGPVESRSFILELAHQLPGSDAMVD